MWLLFLISLAYSVNIEGEVAAPRDPVDKRQWELTRNTKVTLNGGQYTTFLSSDNKFRFFEVPEGTYYLEIFDWTYSFKPVVVEVKDSQITAREGVPGFRPETLPYPLKLRPEKPIQYFEERPKFSVMQLLMNPMVLMALVMVGLTFFSPNMKMDPEQMKEMKEMQKQMQNSWLSSLMQPPTN